MKIPKAVRTILNKLTANNHQAYIVGGAVRDHLLGNYANDFDIATSALPNQVKDIFSQYTIIDTGIKHGTVSIIIKQKKVEVTTFRHDELYLNHRHPQKVLFVDDLKEDLARRDFTMNALAYNNKIIDYFNGIEDIKNKVIRSVGNPEQRFTEDALRILRALRFACQLGFSIDQQTANAIINKQELLRKVSQERITLELDKMLETDITRVLSEYLSVFLVFIPELQTVDLDKTILILKKVENKRTLKLAALLHLWHNPQEILRRLKYPNQVQTQVKIILEHYQTLQADKKNIKRILINTKVDDLILISKFKNAFVKIDIEPILEDIKDDCYLLQDLNIKGSDLIKLGFPKTSIINKILNELLLMVIDDKLKNDNKALIEYVKTEYMKKAQK